MRKEQEKLLKKAEKHNMSMEQMKLLFRDDIILDNLRTIYWYFRGKEDIDGDVLAKEADRCLEMVKNLPGTVPAADRRLILEALLPQYMSTDTLIGDRKKMRIIKVYLHYILELGEDIRFFNMYTAMLFGGYSPWHMNVVLRGLEKCDDAFYILWYNEPLRDDFRHNGKDSLYYYITARTDIMSKYKYLEFPYAAKLYDMDAHRFRVPVTEFGRLFRLDEATGKYTENVDYFNRQVLNANPVLAMVYGFCTSGKLIRQDRNHGVYGTWSVKSLQNPDREKDIRQCAEILNTGFSVQIPAYHFEIRITETGFINARYTEYSSVGVNGINGPWHEGKLSSSLDFLIAPDGRLFQKMTSKAKYYPMQMNTFMRLYDRRNICGEFMSAVLDYHMGRNVFYRDVVHDMAETGCVMPLSFNEIADYHNRADLMKRKYKRSQDMRISWNRQNLNLSYMLVKAATYIQPGKSREILSQKKDIKLLECVRTRMNAKARVQMFVSRMLYESIAETEKKNISQKKCIEVEQRYRSELMAEVGTDILPDEYQTWLDERVKQELFPDLDDLKRTVDDYVRMCLITGNKVRLDVYSIRQMYNLHKRIAAAPNNYRQMTETVNVPKNSVFNRLREILPPEFEWIRTRKRLILETELQHHCVWSYAGKITKDKCAIYSYTDADARHCTDGKPKRYTVEFGCRDGEYHVVQVQGKCDIVNADGMLEYITDILHNCEMEHLDAASGR